MHVLGPDPLVDTVRAGRVGGPLDGDRAAREARPERDDDDVVADLDPPLIDRLGQRDRDRRRGRIPVSVEVHEHLLHRQVEALGHRLDDPDVGLVRDEQVDVGGVSPAFSTAASAVEARVRVANR